MQTGFRYALQKGYHVAVQVDSDGQFPPDRIASLVSLVLDEGWDMVIGSRYLAEPSYEGSHRAGSGTSYCRSIAGSSAARR